MADDLTPQELEELTDDKNVVQIPPQYLYGVSIFAMTDGSPIVHVSASDLWKEEHPDGNLPIQALLDLVREAQDNLLYQKFKETLAADAVRAKMRGR